MHKIRAAREAKGWSQRELSGRLHLPQAHVSRIESGLVDPKLTTVLEIARTLEFDFVLVPRQKLNIIRAMLESADESAFDKPVYALDDQE